LQLISQDHGLVEFGATVYFRIKDALAAVLSVQDWNQATRTLARSMLHRYFCKERVGDICNAQRRKLIISRVQVQMGVIIN
jgi:regulator of protease activity HflC (stomatin/prohibitin superfamily)